ncbi:MAG: B12-binding domain-containing radical SAM protein [Capsulimonadaceae bacterium]
MTNSLYAGNRVPRHPLGGRARVLLCSVFGPYAQDDEYGSRVINPMELYHNQVTRLQGPFSLRMFHQSWGLMFIQVNIEAPCTLLDFPTLDRFIEELRRVEYDVVGIGSITINLLKVREMCRLVRQYQPRATIVVGGHAANIPDLDGRIDTDHIVRGEGVRWFREFLGEDPDRPFRHPQIRTRVGARALGEPMPESPRDVTATLIPSVGCPLGCNFCATSWMFGGKGKFFSFFPDAASLFDIMQQLEKSINAQSFFVMDENFLLSRRRALQILELMQEHDKAWTFYLFSSANAVRRYSPQELVSLGVSWIWLGLEGEDSRYDKLHGCDTLTLVRELQEHGIRVLGSTIIGLENHTPENIDGAIENAVRYKADFHQFMLYTPLHGTPLHAELSEQGRMLDEGICPHCDTHGQYRFNYRHPHIHDGRETEYLLRAFQRDFDRNGPSMLRIVRTGFNGWLRYKHHPETRIRRRLQREFKDQALVFAAAAVAARRYYRHDPALRAKMSALFKDLVQEFGGKSRLYGTVGGRYLYEKICDEERRLAEGWTYEPPMFYVANDAALALPHSGHPPQRAQHVTPHSAQRVSG